MPRQSIISQLSLNTHLLEWRYYRAAGYCANVEVECARLDLAIERLIYTPWIEKYGFGSAGPERLQAHIDATAEGGDWP